MNENSIMNINFKKIKENILIFVIPFFVPILTNAASNGPITSLKSNNITDLAEKLAKFINSWLIPMFVLAALAYFLIGAIQYIAVVDDSKKAEKKQKMFWGLIGLFVMLSVWSLVFVISNTFGVSTGTGDNFMSLTK